MMATSVRSTLPCLFALTLVVACTDDAGSDTGDGTGDDVDGTSDGTSTGTETGTETESDTAVETTGGAVPEFGSTFTVIATADDGLNIPRDLEFNPLAPDQLWTFNMLSHGTVIFFDPGTAQQVAEVRIDAYGQHFMAFVSSAAFGDNGNFASCQESRDEWNVGPQPPDDFMGPTLWSADLDIFAMVGQDFPPGAQEGSHLDMLHQSPWCMGIAHEADNIYWAFDGMDGSLVRYDFQQDHGPGGGDHSDGIITRYLGTSVTRVANIVGHMEFDHQTGMLYVADTGAGRITRLDTTTGTNTGSLPGEWDGAEYTGVTGADYQVVVEGLSEPAGIALDGGRIFVSESASGDIVAFDMEGTELGRVHTPAERIMGITFGPDGRLWYADPGADEIVRIDP